MAAQVYDEEHRLAVLALDGFVPFDLSIPYNIFSMATLPGGVRPYHVFFAGPSPTAASGGGPAITGARPLSEAASAHTVFIPGIENALNYADETVFAALRACADRGVRLASICTGACVLAGAGLLDGLSACTHWEILPELRKAYPGISLEEEAIFVDNGRILTSAGLASGIDLCLHMLRKDYGAAAAAACAEFFVVPVERGGSHAQRIRRVAPQAGDNMSALHMWLMEHLHRPISPAEIADYVCMSERTLNRKFREQTGLAPMAWLNRARVQRAQALLESGDMSVEQIAAVVGFGSTATFRNSFRRMVGVSPAAWRKTYRTG